MGAFSLHWSIFWWMCLLCGRKGEQTNLSNLELWKPSWDSRSIKTKGKVPVRCAISFREVVGTFYFDNSNVNGDSFLHLLNNYFLPMLRELPQNMIAHKEGSPKHCNLAVKDSLNVELSNFWSGRRDPAIWTACSRGLTPSDVLLPR